LQPDFTTTPVVYDKGKFYDPLFYVDPRALLTYRLSDKNQIQFSAGIVSQHTHIINYVNYFLPVEIWTTSNKYLRPERNFQTSFGWVRTGTKFNLSLTAFTKYVRNVLDYASPVFISSAEIESNLLSGFMLATGVEAMINFHFGEKYSITGSYTYTASNQKIEGINNDKPYPTTNSRPHYVAVSQYLNLSKKWKLSSNFTWHSGKAVTLPNGQFYIDGTAFPVFDDNRNAERLRFFSRTDVSLVRMFGWKKKRERVNLSISVTNLFARFNTAVAYVEPVPSEPTELQLISRDYTPFMVYLSLNFKLP
jgi:outer membrane receptor protein involved in Fe transport